MDSEYEVPGTDEAVGPHSDDRRALALERAEPLDAATRVIGVLPVVAAKAKPRLLQALERVFPVRFEERDAGDLTGVDGVLAFTHQSVELGEVERCGLPSLVVDGSESGVRRNRDRAVELASTSRVDSRLRGRRLNDDTIVGLPTLERQPTDDILASTSAGPIWALRSSEGANLYFSSIPLADLRPGESIRDYFRSHRFCSLLPLVHLIKEVTSTTGWTPPPLRATFIIDDPNLHWPSYGYVRFRDLACHARLRGYHIAMATIPLDLWYFDRRAVGIFYENPRELSLVIHGNDHVRNELARARSQHDALELLSQALSRVARFERRSGLRIARVIVPPHGDCSDTMFEALAIAGFAAIAWSPKPTSDISGWGISDFAPGGIPSLSRPLLTDWDDLPFRAYLDQPIVLEGHHTDLEDGLDLLEQTTAEVNRLGSVAWGSPAELARTNFAVRRLGERLEVRLFSRCVRLVVP